MCFVVKRSVFVSSAQNVLLTRASSCMFVIVCEQISGILILVFVFVIQVVIVTSNGTSFDYVSAVPIENGPVSLDRFSTPQYKVDQHIESDGKIHSFIKSSESYECRCT